MICLVGEMVQNSGNSSTFRLTDIYWFTFISSIPIYKNNSSGSAWMDLCMVNFVHSTILFNFIEWFMILFSFSDVKYSLSIFCIEYVLTKNIILLNLYLFTKVEQWQQLVSRNCSMSLHLSYMAQTSTTSNKFSEM